MGSVRSLAVGCALLLGASAALAAPSEAEIDRARDLAREGIRLEESGRCDLAIEKFQQAHKLYPEAPSITQRLAQCYVVTGRLVEAWRTYRLLADTQIDANSSEAFRKAKADGAREYQQLEKRVPRLRVTLKPSPPPSDWQVEISKLDERGKSVGSVLLEPHWLDKERPIDPGRYRLQASAAGHSAEPVELVLSEGRREKRQIALRSAPPEVPEASAVPDASAAPKARQEPAPPDAYVAENTRKSGYSPRRTALLFLPSVSIGFGEAYGKGATPGLAALLSPSFGFGVRHGKGQYFLRTQLLKANGPWLVPITFNAGLHPYPKRIGFFVQGGTGFVLGDTTGVAVQGSLGVSFGLTNGMRLPLGAELLMILAGVNHVSLALTTGLQFDVGLGKKR